MISVNAQTNQTQVVEQDELWYYLNQNNNRSLVCGLYYTKAPQKFYFCSNSTSCTIFKNVYVSSTFMCIQMASQIFAHFCYNLPRTFCYLCPKLVKCSPAVLKIVQCLVYEID